MTLNTNAYPSNVTVNAATITFDRDKVNNIFHKIARVLYGTTMKIICYCFVLQHILQQGKYSLSSTIAIIYVSLCWIKLFISRISFLSLEEHFT